MDFCLDCIKVGVAANWNEFANDCSAFFSGVLTVVAPTIDDE